MRFISFLITFFILLGISDPSDATKKITKLKPNFSLSLLSKSLYWETHQYQRSLHFELLLRAPEKFPLTLRFAQIYFARRGKTIKILNLSYENLLYTSRYLGEDRQWHRQTNTHIKANQALLIPLTLQVPTRRDRCDLLLIKFFVKIGSRLQQKTLTLQPKNFHLPFRLYFPLKGRWWVANAHQLGSPHRQIQSLDAHGIPQITQRFAFDFVKIDKQNRVHRGNPHQNTNYLGFAQPVYAPAKGRVIAIVDSQLDRPPGQPNNKKKLGNYIIIKHANHIFSFLGHLQHHSFHVKVGQTVQAKQLIAQVGNSGNASTPHLHFQLITQPSLEKSQSIPALFWNIIYPSIRKNIIPFSPKVGQIILTL